MGRPAKGSVSWNPRTNEWEVRVTLRDGQRSRPVAMPGVPPCSENPTAPPKDCGCASCKIAEVSGQRVSRTMREGGAVDVDTRETVSEWYVRYFQAAERGMVGRKNRGKPQTSVDDRRARFRTWIEPAIGTKPMSEVTPADLRAIVRTLDEQVMLRTVFYSERDDEDEAHKGRKPGLSAKTAAHVWSEVTNAFAEARGSKHDDLRVLSSNPVDEGKVQGPMTTEEREQAALYASELVALLTCEDVPRARRRVYFVAAYTGMRRSELARMTAADVDLEHGLVTVRGTKTNAAKRQVPIAPALAPLLAALVTCAACVKRGHASERCSTCAGTGKRRGPVLDVPRADGKGGAADLVKRDLERARITRADLTRDDAQHMPFTFHGLRHTAVTHWYLAGRDETWLLVVAGHTMKAMTRRYLDKAAVARSAFGEPHPTLDLDAYADLVSDVEAVEDAGGVLAILAFLDRDGQKQNGKPEGFPVVLTSLWRPQRESNPRYRRERPMS